MIYITLPNLFNFYEINFLKNIPDTYFKIKINFSTTKGNFPFCYWNGGFNNNKDDVKLSYYKISEYFNKINIPVRLNCSNIYLNENDLEDSIANIILELGENGSNEIAISNISFYDILKEKYPNYKYIFSKEADLIYPFNEDIINLINENNIFKLIELPEYKIQDFNFLKKIKNKEKIELPINSICNINCINYKECLYHEHQSQYNFSLKNNFIYCNKINKKNIFLTFNDIKEKYLPLGYKHYSFLNSLFLSDAELINYIVNNFIKEEKQKEILEQYIRGKNDTIFFARNV